MTEPISKEEHSLVENRLTKAEAELATVLAIAKSNADRLDRLDRPNRLK